MSARPLLVLVTVGTTALIAAAGASGHGTIAPASAQAGSSQAFELTVPNDRLDADIVAVALRLPSGIELESAEATQPLWAVSSAGNVVMWQGGPIARASAETFSFTARMPSQSGSVELTLLETYDDGDAAPFPIAVEVRTSSTGGSGSGTTGTLALALGVLSLAVSTAALLLAVRANRGSDSS
jgi:uncharacterized protein YcnI